MAIGRTDYQDRKAARIDRMRARAASKIAESESAANRAHSIASMIPLGQPILTDHYSAGRHRRDIDRIGALYSKAGKAEREAQSLASRADAAEDNRSISSDDPEALGKLRAKLADIRAKRARGVAINKAIRAAKGDMVAAANALVAMGETREEAIALTSGASRWDIGVPKFRLSNLAAEARRLEQRIAQLMRMDAATSVPDEQIGDIKIVQRDNRVQLIFPGKPSEEIRSQLKRNGFHWSPTAGAWQRMPSSWAWTVAREIATAASKAESITSPAPR